MRKTALVSGIILTSIIFIGVVLRILQLPGASPFLILGISTVMVYFLPLLLIYRLKTVTTGFQRVVAVFGLVIGILFLFPGFLFAIQRWPGSALLYMIGTGGGLIFLILFFVSENKSGKPVSLFQPFTIIMTVMLVVLFTGRYFVRQRVVDNAAYNMVEYYKTRNERTVLERATNETYIKIVADTSDTASIRMAEKLHRTTSDVLQYINEIRGEVVGACAGVDPKVGDTLSVSLIGRSTDYDTPTHYFIGSNPANVTGRAKDLKATLTKYYDEMVNLFSEKEQVAFKKRIEPSIPNDIYSQDYEKMISWEWFNFYHKTIIESVTTLEQLKINILTAEKEALEKFKTVLQNKK